MDRFKQLGKLFAIIGGMLALAIFVIPLAFPIPSADGVEPDSLADENSAFIEAAGLEVHYKSVGDGRPAIILLHGFGSNAFSWYAVIDELGQIGTAIAYDRPAFGLTERPLSWDGENPYSADFQVDLVIALMDALKIENAILIGNSAGGTVAMNTALRYPERVEALVLVSPAVYTGGGSPAIVQPFLQTPLMSRIGPIIARNIQEWGRDFAESAWHDPSLITTEIWDGYAKPLQVANWDRALWELTRSSRASDLAGKLDELTLPVLVVTGDDDRIVPTADSIRLAGELPNAQLVVIPNSGHVSHEETPQQFLDAVTQFITGLE